LPGENFQSVWNFLGDFSVGDFLREKFSMGEFSMRETSHWALGGGPQIFGMIWKATRNLKKTSLFSNETRPKRIFKVVLSARHFFGGNLQQGWNFLGEGESYVGGSSRNFPVY
jgi:hypothetical protein